MSPPALRPSAAAVRETIGYRLKCKLLGPPLVTSQLSHERFSKRMALGVLSPDCISSSAYGSEEILVILVGGFGLAAFHILMPMTLVIIGVLIITTLSYRQVVMIYTKAGGSYVVARDNFGPAVAQVGAVALMIDYIVTVAVQTAAGTNALASAIPALSPIRTQTIISVCVVALLFYGNLRGLREAGRWFAFPTYFFVISMYTVLVFGIGRELFGHLTVYPVDQPGQYPLVNDHLVGYAMVFLLLRAFANGGSSLTGLEAISNGVGAFKPPEGRNARRTLVVMSTILGSLVLGVSWLAHVTHAAPYRSGSPTVISQVAHAAFGFGAAGHVAFLLVQLATMLVLYTGGNTSFNGFPFLTSFVAEDSFLPRQLTRRGHRLAFSNGIIVLAILAETLLIVTHSNVSALVGLYAIGVFTGFSLAGYGMAKHFHTHKEPRYKAKMAINIASGMLSTIVVVIFAVTKFTEGAWIVLIVFPVGTFALIRLNRTYRGEAAALQLAAVMRSEPNTGRNAMFVLVDDLDLATIRALRYARGLKPSTLRAVHFVLDAQHAEELHKSWVTNPATGVPLELVECPDRRLIHAVLQFATEACADARTEVTLLMPRRTYSPLLGRLLHDRTADKIAEAVSDVPRVSATIIPFNVDRVAEQAPALVEAVAEGRPPAWLRERLDDQALRRPSALQPATLTHEHADGGGHATPTLVLDDADPDGSTPTQTEPPVPVTPGGVTPIGDLTWRQRAVVEGKVRAVRLTPLSGAPTLEVDLWDTTGGLTVMFYGRRQIGGLAPGARLRAEGMVGETNGHLAMANPIYRLLPAGDEDMDNPLA